MRLLKKALVDGSFLLDIRAQDLESIFHQTLHHVVARGLLPAENRDEVEQALLQRERQASTALGLGFAVPHIYNDVLAEQVIVLVRLARPLNLGAPDGIPTRFLFVLLGPTGFAEEHLDTLMHIVRLMSDDEFRFDAGQAQNRQQLLDAFERFAQRNPPVSKPAPAVKTDGLDYTGRFAGGLLQDIRRRWPHYISDFRDGLHSKCIGSILFLFFACLAPAVTFGGFMSKQTGGQIGVVEMIMASAVCGVIFALFAGQPLIILGGTGPLLVFTGVLYALCADLSVGEHFLAVYAWVGLWTAVLLVLLALTDASCLMRYFTRFTDEIFAALISVIFIYESVRALADIIFRAYRREDISHDTALLSLLLALGTFYIGINLSRFRRSRYLLPRAREFLADFGPTIALAAMTAVAVSLRNDVSLEPLKVPQMFGTTLGRSWLVNPLSAPMWTWFAALLPAMLVVVLLYLDQNITARLVNSRNHKLQKGPAYHLDMLVVGLLIAVCSVFGLPWLAAATVRSLNHVRSLASLEEVMSGGDDRRERINHVRETRVTGLVIHLLIGLSLLLLPVLKLVPMAVLYGLFLYMGIVSIRGNQFFERLSLWLMDSALYPSTHYVRRVPIRTIHKFTLLQLVGLVVLWTVKVSQLAILFPLFIALGVPLRLLASRLFPAEHVEALDMEEEPEDEETQWH
jgi:mannitol/fructose-specific phosphotransferase system IIA component (Ntr-type)